MPKPGNPVFTKFGADAGRFGQELESDENDAAADDRLLHFAQFILGLDDREDDDDVVGLAYVLLSRALPFPRLCGYRESFRNSSDARLALLMTY